MWLLAGSFGMCLLAGSFAIGASSRFVQAPQLTTATYDEWTVRCEVRSGTSGRKLCEITQMTSLRGRTYTQIAIGRSVRTKTWKVVFEVPVNVWVQTDVKFTFDGKNPGFSATFTRCVPNGCFAESYLTDDMVRKLRTRTQPARFAFKDATQHTVVVPVSFKGFSEALDALAGG
jgi:invasion protein IalB